MRICEYRIFNQLDGRAENAVTTDHYRPPPTGTGGSLMTTCPLINYSLVDSLRLHHHLQIIKISVKNDRTWRP